MVGGWTWQREKWEQKKRDDWWQLGGKVRGWSKNTVVDVGLHFVVFANDWGKDD
jgi:hypothetical protein